MFDHHITDTVSHLFKIARECNASDIHIEPQKLSYRIRMRQDGLLREVTALEYDITQRLLAHIKIMAGLNIAEKRLPQDGHFEWESLISIRVNTCATLNGEKMVLRLQHQQSALLLSDIGLTDVQLIQIEKCLTQSQGLLLATGPTGSGKSMTLYAALQWLNESRKNIVTIEDPVEIAFDGVNQLPVQRTIGLDFQTLLRTTLRQDPDVIMVGEIRDAETAKIAMQAVDTGHLVLSTLHTKNVFHTMLRLGSLGVTREQLYQPGTVLVSQRLVRKLCERCKHQRVSGCDVCMNGYAGRVGVFEVLTITEHLADLLLNDAPKDEIKKNLMQQDFINLEESAMLKVAEGVTTRDEVKRCVL